MLHHQNPHRLSHGQRPKFSLKGRQPLKLIWSMLTMLRTVQSSPFMPKWKKTSKISVQKGKKFLFFDINVWFMSYSTCWNCRRTWNLCSLLNFQLNRNQIEKNTNHSYWALKLYLFWVKAPLKLEGVPKCKVRSKLFFSWKLKKNKDSKLDNNFNTSNMTWTGH